MSNSMLQLEATAVRGVGTFFGVPVSNEDPLGEVLSKTGFTSQQVTFQVLAEVAWHLGHDKANIFQGYVVRDSTPCIDEQEFGCEGTPDRLLQSRNMAWARRGDFVLVRPIDRADLRRTLYPANRTYGIEISNERGLFSIVTAQSWKGWAISGDLDCVRSAATLAATDLRVPIKWDTSAIRYFTEGVTNIAQFDYDM
jgi:hypothetical protein